MSTTLPVYDDEYYRDYDGQLYERNENWMALFRHFADRIVKTLDPKTALDAGCALGLLVEALAEVGVDSTGIDVSEAAIKRADKNVSERLKVQSLTDPIQGRFDLVTCIEVIEHLPSSAAHDAVANLCAATDMILLSSTPEEHEEPTHLNVQPPEYWSALFASQGFFRDTNYDATFISPWAVLYRRGSKELTEVVRTYDRAFWRLSDENQRIRTALIETTDHKHALSSILSDDELASASSSANQAARLAEIASLIKDERASGVSKELKARLDEAERSAQEAFHAKLVMRDELMGAQAHAGQLAGRVAEVEAELAAYQGLRERVEQAESNYQKVVESTTWRLMWKVMEPYRRIRTTLARESS